MPHVLKNQGNQAAANTSRTLSFDLQPTRGWKLILISTLLAIGTSASLTSCGKTQFAARTGSPIKKQEDQSSDLKNNQVPKSSAIIDLPIEKAALTDIKWFWQCETNPVELPEKPTEATEELVIGQGLHNLIHNPTLETPLPLKISGHLCPPSSQKREIIIIVDVSGSTFRTDPPPQSSILGSIPSTDCGRAKAVQQLLGSFADQNEIGIGIITFAGEIRSSTDILIPLKDLNQTAYAGENLCESADSTNYLLALNSAQEMFAKSHSGALKEVYFITDGIPDTTTEQESSEAAQEIQKEATIATIMFGGGASDFLKEAIASKGRDGNPIHIDIARAEKLAETLAELAKTYPVSGTYKYKAVSEEDWIEGDLWLNVNDGKFELDTIELGAPKYDMGIEFQYSYEDNRGKTISQEGKLKWK